MTSRRLLIATILLAAPAAAQDTAGVSITFGGAGNRQVAVTGIPDSILARALERFNAPATIRAYGGAQVNAPVGGTLGVYDGDARIATRVDGDVVIINGSLRLDSSAVVTGEVIVLGGRFYPDPGAQYRRPVIAYDVAASVRRTGDATLVATAPAPTLRDLAGRVMFQRGPLVLAPRVDLGVYNRVEGLPIHLGPSITWRATPEVTAHLDAELILRTAQDPSDTRDANGWWARAMATVEGARRLRLGIEAANRVASTADAPFRPAEASLSALVLRRDHRDWFSERGTRAFAAWEVRPGLTVDATFAVTRERSLPALDAFSFLRSGETWRANPLVDDGRFTAVTGGLAWDTRDASRAPRDGWWIRGGVRSTTSSELTPTLLPETVRDPLPTDGYGAVEAWFDARRYQRLDFRHAIHFRLAGEGWIGGDPLTVQRRLGLGGSDELFALPFRAISCDARRRPDPARPALCDRRLVAQVELRRRFDVNVATRVGPYGLGIDQLEAVLLADFGSAWIAGDGPGRVPANRIQSLGEWRGLLGAGLDGGWFGAYLGRSFTDDEPFRLTFRLQRRF
jgi:hypothetical protein